MVSREIRGSKLTWWALYRALQGGGINMEMERLQQQPKYTRYVWEATLLWLSDSQLLLDDDFDMGAIDPLIELRVPHQKYREQLMITPGLSSTQKYNFFEMEMKGNEERLTDIWLILLISPFTHKNAKSCHIHESWAVVLQEPFPYR